MALSRKAATGKPGAALIQEKRAFVRAL